MPDSATTRREFIRSAAGGAAGAAAALTALNYANAIGANDRVRVGIVGFSDRSKGALIPAFLACAKTMNFEVAAVSDIWSRRREEGRAFLEERAGRPVAACRNNDELYDRKDIDAVIVGTADFQHARHAVEAVRAGRDAYVEKPLANTTEDARAVLKAVEETKRIVQIGTQRRSALNYARASEFIRSGRFGDLVMVELTWNVNQPGRWRRPKLVPLLKEEDTDWNRFLMNRPKEPFDPRKYVEFRLFWPYSSGIPDQWLVHQIDTVHWYTGLPRPRSVVANGGIYGWKDGRTNFDTLTVVFDYGPLDDPSRGFQVVYSSRFTNSAAGTREMYYSNAGTLNLDTNRISPEGGLKKDEAAEMGLQPNLLPEQSLVEAVPKMELAPNAGADDSTVAHMRDWMECVRSRKAPHADIRAGYSHSVALCMTIAAMHTGKRVTFDDVRQEVVVS